MGMIPKKIAVTLFLAILSIWLIVNGRLVRKVNTRSFDISMEAADQLINFPGAQYEIGYQFWFQNQIESALQLFQRTVSKQYYHLDAWLKMGEIETSLGNRQRAMMILKYTDQVAPNVYRWKWRQTLLANSLGLDKIFIYNINYLIPFPKSRQNALYLIDQKYDGNATKIMKILENKNQIPYFEWLMEGGRVDDVQSIWRLIDKDKKNEHSLLPRYIHFMLQNRRVRAAKTEWYKAGQFGIINPGFEKEISNRGFGWRYYNPKTLEWIIKRKFLLQSARGYVVQVAFSGQKNLNFGHFFQIYPTAQKKKFRLSWDWKSRQLTTDQRPFIEIYGFECNELYIRGPMLPPSSDWQSAKVEFEVPDKCEAVVIQLRRLPSKRFDSKLNGKLWMDNFKMQEI